LKQLNKEMKHQQQFPEQTQYELTNLKHTSARENLNSNFSINKGPVSREGGGCLSRKMGVPQTAAYGGATDLSRD